MAWPADNRPCRRRAHVDLRGAGWGVARGYFMAWVPVARVVSSSRMLLGRILELYPASTVRYCNRETACRSCGAAQA